MYRKKSKFRWVNKHSSPQDDLFKALEEPKPAEGIKKKYLGSILSIAKSGDTTFPVSGASNTGTKRWNSQSPRPATSGAKYKWTPSLPSTASVRVTSATKPTPPSPCEKVVSKYRLYRRRNTPSPLGHDRSVPAVSNHLSTDENKSNQEINSTVSSIKGPNVTEASGSKCLLLNRRKSYRLSGDFAKSRYKMIRKNRTGPDIGTVRTRLAPLVATNSPMVSRFRIVRSRRSSTTNQKPRQRTTNTRYSVSRDGKTLRRISLSEPQQLKRTFPQKPQAQLRLLGATFMKEGNVYKLDRTKDYVRKRVSLVLNRSIRLQSRKATKVDRRHCFAFTKFGRCTRGKNCLFVHDTAKVAICSTFLRGKCSKEDCVLSHQINPDNMPICKFFEMNRCHKLNCPYLHVKHADDVKPCVAFQRGHCPNGRHCSKKHVLLATKRTWKAKKAPAKQKQSVIKNNQAKLNSLPVPSRKRVYKKPGEISDKPFDDLGDVIRLDSSESEQEDK